MSLLVTLRDFYFDALDLHQNLEQFHQPVSFRPTEKLKSRRFESSKALVNHGEGLADQPAWILSVNRLRKDLDRLQEEIRCEINRVRPEEISEGLESQLFWVEKMVFYFSTVLEQIEVALKKYEEDLAHESIFELKEHSHSLQKQISKLDKML